MRGFFWIFWIFIFIEPVSVERTNYWRLCAWLIVKLIINKRNVQIIMAWTTPSTREMRGWCGACFQPILLLLWMSSVPTKERNDFWYYVRSTSKNSLGNAKMRMYVWYVQYDTYVINDTEYKILHYYLCMMQGYIDLHLPYRDRRRPKSRGKLYTPRTLYYILSWVMILNCF